MLRPTLQVRETSPVIRPEDIPVDTFPGKQEYRQALCDSILPPVSKILPLTLSPTSPGSHIPDGRFFALAKSQVDPPPPI